MRFSMITGLILTSGCLEPAPVAISDPPVDTIEVTTTPPETTETTTDPEPPEGQCGDVSNWDLFVEGAVIDFRDQPYAGVEIILEDRGWIPGTILGTATTDDEGVYTFDVSQLTSVEDCWGTLLDYVIVGTEGDLVAEEGVNAQLYSAIVDGTLEVDLYSFPLVLE
jgi:hypothetical protein